ncbi:hypothetical protein D3C80_1239960 [compost metagenome]
MAPITSRAKPIGVYAYPNAIGLSKKTAITVIIKGNTRPTIVFINFYYLIVLLRSFFPTPIINKKICIIICTIVAPRMEIA